MQRQVREGDLTKVVYSHIESGDLSAAIKILHDQLQMFPRSRAALSLLAYCYYQLQDFYNASQMYASLVNFYPQVEEYKVYYIQSLAKAGMYSEANSILQFHSSENERLLVLQAHIYYDTEEMRLAKNTLDHLTASSSSSGGLAPEAATALSREDAQKEKLVFEAALLWKEQRYEEALKGFQEVAAVMGFQPFLAYNIALCYFSMKQYGPALKHLSEIIEKGLREHPEWSGLSSAEGQTVGNTFALKETGLIEAFNLKAAIEYQLENVDGKSNY